jgi:hypothetical protein
LACWANDEGGKPGPAGIGRPTFAGAEVNWTDAVARMKAGHVVRRASQPDKWLGNDTKTGAALFVTDAEPIMLAAAWTQEDTPAFVFRGLWSRELFVPDDDNRNAADWEIAT